MLLLLVLLVLGCFTVIGFVSNDEDVQAPALAVGIVGLLLWLTIVGGSVQYHAQDLGYARGGGVIVKAYQERIEGLRGSIRDIVQSEKMPHTALLNMDTPVKALADQLAVAETEYAKARNDLAQANINIESRKAGPFWFVVWIYGDK